MNGNSPTQLTIDLEKVLPLISYQRHKVNIPEPLKPKEISGTSPKNTGYEEKPYLDMETNSVTDFIRTGHPKSLDVDLQ